VLTNVPELTLLLHHRAAVVVVAQDVAGAPNGVGEGLTIYD
jgi:hypothetical protein